MLITVLSCAAVLTCMVLIRASLYKDLRRLPALFSPGATPWQSIGGCGLGGSGGGASGQSVRWIGNSLHGHILTVRIQPDIVPGPDRFSLGVAPSLTLTAPAGTQLGVTLPFRHGISEVTWQEQLGSSVHINGGIGDITMDLHRSFGFEGQFSWRIGCTFPTGEWDVTRGEGAQKRILPASLQSGRGIYEAVLRLERNARTDDGMLIIGATLAWPFNMRTDKRNEYLDSDYREYKNESRNRSRFYYKHYVKPYGETDRGDYYPPTLLFDAAYGKAASGGTVHSLQASMAVPCATRWIHHYNPQRYDPSPDPDHQAWRLLLAYGVEFRLFPCPIFAGAGLPIGDKRGPNDRWDGIDTDYLFREWIFTAGITCGIL